MQLMGAAEVGCTGSGTQPTLSFDLEGTTADLDFDLSEAFFEVVISTTPTVSTTLALDGSLTCSISTPALIAFVGLTEIEVSVSGSFTLSAQAPGQVVTTTVGAPIQMGMRFNDGLVEDLTDLDTDGSVAGLAQVEEDWSGGASLEVGPSIAVKEGGLAGLSIGMGLEVGVEINPSALPCAVLSAELSVGLSAVVGTWFVNWSWTLAEISTEPLHLYEQIQGCPAATHEWRGTIQVSIHRKFDSGGDAPTTATYDEDATYDLLGRLGTAAYAADVDASGSATEVAPTCPVPPGGNVTRAYTWSLSGTVDAVDTPILLDLVDEDDGTAWISGPSTADAAYEDTGCGNPPVAGTASLSALAVAVGVVSRGGILVDNDPDPIASWAPPPGTSPTHPTAALTQATWWSSTTRSPTTSRGSRRDR